MSNVTIVKHPILAHKLSFLRDKSTSRPEFRHLMREISEILAYEATRERSLEQIEVETPFGKSMTERVADDIAVVTIMRAGNGMIDGVLEMLPFAKVGHIGIYKDKFINHTVEYYFKLPDNIETHQVILLDPVLATGTTLLAAIDRLKQYDIKNIKVLTVIAHESGIQALAKRHPDVQIYTLSVENEINDDGLLVPGIGDVSDRLFS